MQPIIDFIGKYIGNPYVSGFFISMLPIGELRLGLPYIYLRLGDGVGNFLISFIIAYTASSMMCPIILALFRPILAWLKKRRIFRRLALSVELHFRKKSKKLKEKQRAKNLEEAAESGPSDKSNLRAVEVQGGTVVLEENLSESEPTEERESEEEKRRKKRRLDRILYFGLFIFTAIPLPFTGVWTASGIAALLNLDFKRSMKYIVLGNLVAGVCISIVALVMGRVIGAESINVAP